MESELTLGDIYEDIAERLAMARTKALMGERQEALGVFRGASLDYRRFHEVLQGFPGYHALEHAFQVTLTTLASERSEILPVPVKLEAKSPLSRTSRVRRKTSQAA